MNLKQDDGLTGSPLTIKARILNLGRRRVIQDIIALFGVQSASFLLPLATVPYLSRILGPSGWGEVAIVQSMGTYLGFFVEYGFDFSATREVARSRHDPDRLAEIISGVIGAKSLLSIAAVIIALLTLRWAPQFAGRPILIWSGIFLGVSQGFNAMWLFQGLERMRLVATIEITCKLLSTAGTFLLVRSATDGPRLLMLYGAAALASTAFTLAFAYCEARFQLPSIRTVKEALQTGWATFLFKSSTGLFSTANALILSFFVAPNLVGQFAAAEKISKAAWGMLWPVTRVLFPKMSYLVRHNLEAAAGTARVTLATTGGASLVMGGILFCGARPLVTVLFGHSFEQAIPILRLFSILPVIMAFNNVLGIHWMMPLGFDRALNRIVLEAGVLNIVLALLLARVGSGMGMTCSIVLSETWVLAGIYRALNQRGHNLFAGSYRLFWE